MFNTLKRLYNNGEGPLDKEGLKNAVEKNWITAEQYKELTGESYTV